MIDKLHTVGGGGEKSRWQIGRDINIALLMQNYKKMLMLPDNGIANWNEDETFLQSCIAADGGSAADNSLFLWAERCQVAILLDSTHLKEKISDER